MVVFYNLLPCRSSPCECRAIAALTPVSVDLLQPAVQTKIVRTKNPSEKACAHVSCLKTAVSSPDNWDWLWSMQTCREAVANGTGLVKLVFALSLCSPPLRCSRLTQLLQKSENEKGSKTSGHKGRNRNDERSRLPCITESKEGFSSHWPPGWWSKTRYYLHEDIKNKVKTFFYYGAVFCGDVRQGNCLLECFRLDECV